MGKKKSVSKGAGSVFIQLKSLKNLLGLRNGGGMLKGNQKKLDKNKDGKISGEDFKLMKKANKGMSVKGDDKRDIRKTESMIGASKSSKREKEIKKKRNLQVSDSSIKASMGKSIQGYGAARTSGMGLQDEQLPPGKTLDYYKDIM